MTFLGKSQPAPTSTVLVKDQVTFLPIDPEKSNVQGNEIQYSNQSHHHRVLPHTERKVVRKMDFRIVPLVTALYVLAFLDRSNIGKYVFSEPKSPLSYHILSLEACSRSVLFPPENMSIHRLQFSTLTAEAYSSASIAGMTDDLRLVGSDYQWLLTIFYIAYIIFEFQALMWKIVPPQYVFRRTNHLPNQNLRLQTYR